MNWVVQFLVALFTFVAVVVALFGQYLRARFFPPELRLSLLDPGGDRSSVQLTAPGPVPQQRFELGRYYRMVISNELRWSVATDVSVMLVQLEEIAANGDFHVTWRGDIPLEWENQHLHSVGRTIGTSARIDLCSVVKGKWLKIHPLVHAFNLPVEWNSAAKIRLTLVAKSREVDSAPVTVQILWDGGWDDGEVEMRRHLVLEVQ